jgi:hypothetical protein
MSKPKHSPRMPFALLVTGLVVGGLVLLLVLNTFSAANELRRHDLASRDASIAEQVQELANEVADSAAPANLAAAAVALGMVPAGNPAFLVIGADGSVHVMGSAAPAAPAIVDLPNPPAAPKPPAKSGKHDKKHDKKKEKDGKKSDGNKHAKRSSTSGKKKHDAKQPHKQDGKHPTKDKKQHTDERQPDPTTTLTLPGGDR